jgi:uncharacterized protein (TIGR01777 family)
MRILLTGGTGFIGSALCKSLLARGDELTVLSRNSESVKAKCGAQVKTISTLNEWAADLDFDAIINLAGESIIDAPWTDARKLTLRGSRVALTEHLIKCIERAKHRPKVLLSGSAIGYYGYCGDQTLDESATPARDFSAQLCVDWESAAMRAAGLGVRVCLLRLAPVLGKGGGMLGRMAPAFKLGLGARIGKGTQWMSWIHIDDCVAIMLRLLEDSQAAGPFNLTAPQPVTNRSFTRALSEALNRPAMLVAPACVMRLALQERADLLLGSQRVLPGRLEAMRYHFKYPDVGGALKSLAV